jgi:hypothetical protein
LERSAWAPDRYTDTRSLPQLTMPGLSSFAKIAPYLTNPLVLAGFALFLAYGVCWALLRSGILRPIDQAEGSKIVRLIIHYGFWTAIGMALLGFIFEAYVGSRETKPQPAVPIVTKSPANGPPGPSSSPGAPTLPRSPSPRYGDLDAIFTDTSSLAVIAHNRPDAAVARDPKYVVILRNLNENFAQSLPIYDRIDSGDFIKPNDFGLGPYSVIDPVQLSAFNRHINKGDRLFGVGSVTCSNCKSLACYLIDYTYGVGGWYARLPQVTEHECELSYNSLLNDALEEVRQRGPRDPTVILEHVAEQNRVAIRDRVENSAPHREHP